MNKRTHTQTSHTDRQKKTMDNKRQRETYTNDTQKQTARQAKDEEEKRGERRGEERRGEERRGEERRGEERRGEERRGEERRGEERRGEERRGEEKRREEKRREEKRREETERCAARYHDGDCLDQVSCSREGIPGRAEQYEVTWRRCFAQMNQSSLPKWIMQDRIKYATPAVADEGFSHRAAPPQRRTQCRLSLCIPPFFHLFILSFSFFHFVHFFNFLNFSFFVI